MKQHNPRVVINYVRTKTYTKIHPLETPRHANVLPITINVVLMIREITVSVRACVFMWRGKGRVLL